VAVTTRVGAGQVDRLPDKGNIVGEGQWYAVVTVPGTALPGFRLSNFTLWSRCWLSLAPGPSTQPPARSPSAPRAPAASLYRVTPARPASTLGTPSTAFLTLSCQAGVAQASEAVGRSPTVET
jgi:hypothetical protein